MSRTVLDMYNQEVKNRDYKVFVCGSIYHVYNRGNNKEVIFYDDEDRRAFLFRLGLALGFEFNELSENPLTSIPSSRIRIINSKKDLFKLHAFCLMKNHFHLLIEQCSDVPISKLISKVCTSYAMYINKKYKRVGHVFQDKFKAVLMEDYAQLMWTSAYIHTNPVKDGYVSHPSKYKWSSFNDYVLNRNLPLTYKNTLESVVKNDFERETLELMKDTSRTVLDIYEF